MVVLYNFHFAAGSFTQINFVADFIRSKLNFIFKNKKWVLSHPVGDLGVAYALHLSL